MNIHSNYICLPKKNENNTVVMFLFKEKIMFMFKGNLCFENAGIIRQSEVKAIKEIFITFCCKFLVFHFECLTQFNDIYNGGLNIQDFYENIINLYLIGIEIEDNLRRTLSKLKPKSRGPLSNWDQFAMMLNTFSESQSIDKKSHEFFNILGFTRFNLFSSKLFHEIPCSCQNKIGRFFKYNKFIYKNKSACAGFVDMFKMIKIYVSLSIKRKRKKI